MVRLAVIDCGTNTFNLLVVDINSGGEYTRVYSSRIAVKLGQGAINKGFIDAEPFNRGIEALCSFNEVIQKLFVNRVLAFATSAIRDAANRKEFTEEAFNRTGININVINGNKEAELIYLGNREAVDLDGKISLIMDIGGGSTEFILADKNQIHWKQSFNIGAARLFEKFDHSNPISEQEIGLIFDYLAQNLSPVFDAVKKHPPSELIGSSGAFDSVVEMIHGELDGEPLKEGKTGYEINIGDYQIISQKIKDASIDQRKKINGLIPMRFDMIVISCLLIDFTLKAFNLNKFRVSTYSLKEGAIAEFMNQQRKIHLEKN